ncbi:restriction endonuclease subunit S, partial [Eubacterium sp. CAG:156]|uniref:restriction endonuclease subunit S n=1 Tax=Eubacterium sp. CAG:156 TaxID=1262880 RepID=UPI000AA3FDC6
MEKTWVNISNVLFFQEGPGVRNTQYTTEGVKLLNVANLVDGKVDLSTSDRYISEDEAYGKYKHFLCDAGDFIIASSGIKVEYIDKKMGFVDESMLPLCMNTSTIRFKVLDDNQLRIRYFMYYLKSQHFKNQLFKQITGSAQLNYGPSHLKKMIMPLINLSKQDEIIACMDKVQSIIEMRQQELVKLDDLIKARFVEMFGNPVYNEKGWETK